MSELKRTKENIMKYEIKKSKLEKKLGVRSEYDRKEIKELERKIKQLRLVESGIKQEGYRRNAPSEKSSGKGKGWHGDPQGHSAAAKKGRKDMKEKGWDIIKDVFTNSRS